MKTTPEQGDTVVVSMGNGYDAMPITGTIFDDSAVDRDGKYGVQVLYTGDYPETLWLTAEEFTVTYSGPKVNRAKFMRDKLDTLRKELSAAHETLNEAIQIATSDEDTETAAELMFMRDAVRRAALPHLHRHIGSWNEEYADRLRTYGRLYTDDSKQ